MKPVLITMLLILSACCNDNGDIVVTPSIVGTWQYTYPSNPSCSETHVYSITGSFSSTNFEEIKTGIYSITKLFPDGKKELQISITANNGLVTCTGINSGIGNASYIVKITSATLAFYTNATDNLPSKVFNRL